MRLTESTDPVEHAHDLSTASIDVVNLAITQSDYPLTSLEEGESRIRFHLNRCQEEMYNYQIESKNLKRVKAELMEAQAIGLRMLTMVNDKLDRQGSKNSKS